MSKRSIMLNLIKKSQDYQNSSPSSESNSPRIKSTPVSKNKYQLSRHPYYNQYEIDEIDPLDSEYTKYDVELWAHQDWNTFEIDIETRYNISSNEMSKFREGWFLANYGCAYYCHDVLNYDFNLYKQDLYQFFGIKT